MNSQEGRLSEAAYQVWLRMEQAKYEPKPPVFNSPKEYSDWIKTQNTEPIDSIDLPDVTYPMSAGTIVQINHIMQSDDPEDVLLIHRLTDGSYLVSCCTSEECQDYLRVMDGTCSLIYQQPDLPGSEHIWLQYLDVSVVVEADIGDATHFHLAFGCTESDLVNDLNKFIQDL